MSLTKLINEICDFRANNPIIKGRAYGVNDPNILSLKNNLKSLAKEFEKYFQEYRGCNFKFNYSDGASNFPNVFWVAILPLSQKVSNGIYVVICFDILGRGALIGCAESKSNPRGLKTIKRTEGIRKKELYINVDGSGSTTHYNDVFANPKELFKNQFSENDLKDHLRKSIDLAMINIAKQSPEEIPELDNLEEILRSADEDVEQSKIENSNISETQKKRLIDARMGQGKFRQRVERIEKNCRLTSITHGDFLVASHIKPWKDSNNQERLDGYNGLLLSPHVDRLFDKGWISFTDNGDVLIANEQAQEVIGMWNITVGSNIGSFTKEQQFYLEYHRNNIFRKIQL